ncbi:MAG TPA: DHA2 family efflux MFS transporter permease subunit, partial [Polyangiaceae bacterium]
MKVRPNLVLAICCLSVLVMSMDGTIVNVALPAIRKDLSASTAGLQWIVDVYTLVIATLLMLGGSIADRFGRRRTLQTGMIVFALTSGLCSVAPNVNALIACRALQAVGGCMLNPVAMSIITNVFLDPKERAKAIGAWGATAAVSMAFGPLLGGALTQSIGWRAIFWINIPIGAIAVVLAQLFVPESKAPRARKIDPVGQGLVLVALSSLTYAVIEGRRHGWFSPLITSLFALSFAAVVALVVYEPRQEEPMLDLRFFKSAPFSFAAITAVGAFGAFSGFGFLNALYLQEVRGLTAFQSGFYTMPIAIMSFVFAPISGRLLGTYGARLPLLLAGLCLGVGSLILTRVEATTPVV